MGTRRSSCQPPTLKATDTRVNLSCETKLGEGEASRRAAVLQGNRGYISVVHVVVIVVVTVAVAVAMAALFRLGGDSGAHAGSRFRLPWHISVRIGRMMRPAYYWIPQHLLSLPAAMHTTAPCNNSSCVPYPCQDTLRLPSKPQQDSRTRSLPVPFPSQRH